MRKEFHELINKLNVINMLCEAFVIELANLDNASKGNVCDSSISRKFIDDFKIEFKIAVDCFNSITLLLKDAKSSQIVSELLLRLEKLFSNIENEFSVYLDNKAADFSKADIAPINALAEMSMRSAKLTKSLRDVLSP